MLGTKRQWHNYDTIEQTLMAGGECQQQGDGAR
jgi:hypothetical protein